MRKIWSGAVGPVALASLLVASAGALAAEPGDPAYRRVHRPAAAPHASEAVRLVPDCREGWDAELLRCQPRVEVSEPEQRAVTVRRRAMLTFPAKPYPQLFNWDYP